jgi:hypothetical protein
MPWWGWVLVCLGCGILCGLIGYGIALGQVWAGIGRAM